MIYKKSFLMAIMLIFPLICSCLLLAGQRTALPQVEKPALILVDANYIYIADDGYISVFNKEDKRYIKKLGRRGQGPGEFENEIIPYIADNKLFVASNKKATIFNKSLEISKEIIIHKRYAIFYAVGENFVGWKIFKGQDDYYLEYYLFNETSGYEKFLFRCLWGAIHLNKTREFIMQYYFATSGNKVVILYPEGFEFGIFNSEGKEIKIKRSIERVPFTKKDKEDVFAYWQYTPPYSSDIFRYKQRTIFPKVFPAVYACCIDGDLLYIFTYNKKNNGECFVYNISGEFVKKVYAKIERDFLFVQSIIAVYKNVLYRVAWNDKTDEWNLLESKIN